MTGPNNKSPWPRLWSSDESSPRQSALILGLLALAALLAYANSFDVPFYFDDLPNIVDTAQVRAEDLSLEELASAWQKDQRPVANLSFALNYLVHDYEVAGYHVVNLAIHVLTGWLLYLLFVQTLVLVDPDRSPRQCRAIALAAALLWLVHPLHTQTVTYIVQRMNALAALFFVLAMVLYVAGRRNRRPHLQALAFTGCAAAGLCALGSKQNAAMLPLFLLLYERFFFQEARVAWLRKSLPWLAGAAVLVALAGVYYLGGGFEGLGAAVQRGYRFYDFTLVERVLTELRVVVYYVSLVFYPDPARLHLDYDFALSRSLLDPPTTLLSLLAIVGALAAAALAARRYRIASFAVLWFLGNLVIESSIFGLDLVFEHRTYLPSMFLFLAVTSALYAVPARRTAFAAVVLALASVSVYWTHQRNDTWRDPVRFWSDNVAKAPGAVRPKLSLGKALRADGRVDEAIAQYRAALARRPGYYKAHYNLGNALAELDRHTEAEVAYRNALRLQPDSPMAHYNLGNSLLALDRTGEAGTHYRRATELDPDHHKAYYNLAVVMMRSGRPDAAIPLLERTIELEPGIATAHYYLGRIMALAGQRDIAIGHLRNALTQQPNYPQAQALLRRLEATKMGSE